MGREIKLMTDKTDYDFAYTLIVSPITFEGMIDTIEQTYERMQDYLAECFGNRGWGYDLHSHKRIIKEGLYEISLILSFPDDEKTLADSTVNNYIDVLIDYGEISSGKIDEGNSFPCKCIWRNGRVVDI